MSNLDLAVRPFEPPVEIAATLLTRTDLPLSRIGAAFVEELRGELDRGTDPIRAHP